MPVSGDRPLESLCIVGEVFPSELVGGHAEVVRDVACWVGVVAVLRDVAADGVYLEGSLGVVLAEGFVVGVLVRSGPGVGEPQGHSRPE